MITKTQAIKNFLNLRTHADLAALYTPEMECQVNVAQDGGEKITGDFKGRTWHGWTDGLTTWKPIRIPRNANTNPVFDDSSMAFDIAAHVEGVGMTGWNWKKGLSLWVAFDFDAIVGHSDKHSKAKGLTDEQLAAIRHKAEGVPWITIRRSTSGNGLHFYVFLGGGVPTANHNEHAALGRSIISKLSGVTGTDFDTKVDICGQNMWVWHRKMTSGNDGLALIRQGQHLTEVPRNWKDHVKVVTGVRSRNLPRFIADLGQNTGIDDLFLELTGQTTRIPLDEEHIRLINYLEDKKTASVWDTDHHMLITHTVHLRNAHLELGLRGMYATVSQGNDPDTNNCYMFPIRRGGWAVRRYSLGVQEEATWDQDGKGWTRCYFNCNPDLPTAAKSFGAIESPTRGFVFKEAHLAQKAAESLGALVPNLAPGLNSKEASLREHKDGRLLLEITGDDSGAADMPGWLHEKKRWRRLFTIQAKAPIEPESLMYDSTVRHVTTASNEDYGWLLYSDDQWRNEPLVHIRVALKGAMSVSSKEVDNILGSAVMRCWRLVNLPFQPEFPGNREWNKDSAQFRVIPNQDVDALDYPTWQSILAHCGAGLDEALKTNPWAMSNGVTRGADYLKIWCASVFKEPTQPLPYLFFYGNQNCGKSIFHEALSKLLTKGYQRADAALTNERGFNDELRNAIICVVEEINLRKSKTAENRIKDWVTARELPINPRGETPYHVPNTTHWIQCANHSDFCPAFPGDTRITMIHVEDLDPTEMIPKKDIEVRLMDEAADFLAALLLVELPPSNDRLNVPVIATVEKIELEKMNRNPLEVFIADYTWPVPGNLLTVSEFYARFTEVTDPQDLDYWKKNRVGQNMPPEYPRGRNPKDGSHCYGNISFEQEVGPRKAKLITRTNDKGVVFLISSES